MVDLSEIGVKQPFSGFGRGRSWAKKAKKGSKPYAIAADVADREDLSER
jgi:hypothetical protein